MHGIDKAEEKEGEKCINCGCKIREDLLQKLKKNRGKESVICEFCGVELSKIEKSNSSEKRDNKAQLKLIERQMRIFIYRYIYKTLNSPNFIYKILKKQRDLTKSQINNLAEGLKDIIIQYPFPKEWIESLSIDKNEFVQYHYFLRKALDEPRFYQEQYLPFFRESIPLIFGLIIGKYNLSRIQDAVQLEGIEDLKKMHCIHFDAIQIGSFEYYLTLLLCRFIYTQIIKSDFNNLTPESDKSKLVITIIGAPVLKMVLFQKLEKQPYFKTLFNKNKGLKEEYNRFQSELNYNHIYIESFIDCLLLLIDMISDIMKGTCPFSKLSGIKHEIIVNLIRQDKFESDPRFSPLFRDNLTLILSHNILLRLYLLAEKNHVELQQVEPTETCINELSEDIKQDTIKYKEIKQEYLTPIIYMELEEFNKLYQKLREELQKDKILAERFRFYLAKLITIIVENLDNINLPRSLTLEQAIAPTLNILKAVILPDLVKRKIIKSPQKLLKKLVLVKDLLKVLNIKTKRIGKFIKGKRASLIDVITPEVRPILMPIFQGESPLKVESNKNLTSFLIQTILYQVEKNEKALIEHYKSLGNPYGFTHVKGGNQFSVKDYNLLSSPNLAKFFGVTKDTIKKWKSNLFDPDFSLSTSVNLEKILFRKIRSWSLRLFNVKDKSIQEGRQIIFSAINAYMNKYYDNLDYISKICFLLDDCAEWDSAYAHSEPIVSRKLEMNKDYLYDIRKRSVYDKEYDALTYYFRLATNLLLIDYSDFKFESREKYQKFRKGAMDIIFAELVDKGLFTPNLKVQYEALIYTHYALTIARINKYGSITDIPDKYKNDRNRKGFATLDQISIESGYSRQGISNRLKRNLFLTPIMVSSIKSVLEKNRRSANKECDVAQVALEQIPRLRLVGSMFRYMSYVGTISHPVLENFFRKAFAKKGFNTQHEKCFNKPYSYHRIDSLIEIKSQYNLLKTLNQELIQEYGLDFNLIKEIFIDYIIPSSRDLNYIFDKIENRPYVAEDRILFIVFYGKYDNSFFEVLQNRFSKSKIKNKENIRFLDIIDFANLFSLEDNEMTELSHLNKLIIDTVNLKKEMRLEALKVLEDYSSDAM